MLKSKLIKLIFFERKEVRLLYFSATVFRSHTSPAIFVPVLCLLFLCYAHYACTMPIYNHPFPIQAKKILAAFYLLWDLTLKVSILKRRRKCCLFGLSCDSLRQRAYDVGRANGIKVLFNDHAGKVDKDWVYRFSSRHPDRSLRKP